MGTTTKVGITGTVAAAVIGLAITWPWSAAIPHAGDDIKELEHIAAMELVADSLITTTATKSGTWGDTTVWSGGAVPGPTDFARIPAPFQVDIDADYTSQPVRAIRVDPNAILNVLPDRNTGMKCQTLIVVADLVEKTSGTLQLGTVSAPIQPQFVCNWVIGDRGVRDSTQQAYDPLDISGCIMSHGHFSAYGAAKTPFVTPTVAVMKGGTTVSIPPPSGWNVGDELLFPGVHFGQTEVNSIAALSPDGATLTLATPLVYDHTYGDTTAPVGNLTRNIVISSENTTDLTRRGHVMQMHSPTSEVHYVQFKDLGRTSAKTMHTMPATVNYDPTAGTYGAMIPGTDANTMGRYGGFHSHIRSGATYTQTPIHVDGCVAMGSAANPMPKNAFVHHGAYEFITNCIACFVMGTGFFCENGSEIGAHRGNLAVACTGMNLPDAGLDSRRGDDPTLVPTLAAAGPIPDDNGFQSVGMWITPLVEVTDCKVFDCNIPMVCWPVSVPYDMAPGSRSYALAVNVNPPAGLGFERPTQANPQPFPTAGGVRNPTPTPVDTTKLEVRSLAFYVARTQFAGCRDGFNSYQELQTNPTLSGLDIIGGEGGLTHTAYTRNLQVLNCRIRGMDFSVKGYPGSGQGIGAGNQVSRDFFLSGDTVTGWTIGHSVPPLGDNVVQKCTFNNIHDIQVPLPYPGSLTITSTTFGASLPATSNYGKQSQITLDNAQSSYSNFGLNLVNSLFAPFRMNIDGTEIIHNCRLPGYIPFPAGYTTTAYNWKPGYAGLTNAQLFAQFGVWVGGYQIPDQILTPHPNVTSGGGVGVIGAPVSGGSPPPPPPPPPATPTATLTASATTIVLGQPAMLNWTSTNATTVMLNGSAVALIGSEAVSPSATTTYTLSATGAGGTVTQSLTVTVVVVVPDVATPINNAIDQENAALVAAGLPGNLSHVTQSPAAGSQVAPGTAVTVN